MSKTTKVEVCILCDHPVILWNPDTIPLVDARDWFHHPSCMSAHHG